MRNFLYDVGVFKAYKSSIKVICVGNVQVGGSGKTPLCEILVNEALSQGLRPAIMLRGYKGREKGPHEVLSIDDYHRVGDEALLHRLKYPDTVPVVVSANRVKGAKYLEKMQGIDVIILDDGFQHRALARDVNVLIIPAVEIMSEKAHHLLPLGSFREPLFQALARADVLVVIARGEQLQIPKNMDSLPLLSLCMRIKEIRYRNSSDWHDISLHSGTKVFAFSALGDNDQFFRTLLSAGLLVQGTKGFSDHHNYIAKDLEDLRKRAGDFPLITTEKDSVKLREAELQKVQVGEIWICRAEIFGESSKRRLRDLVF